MKSNGSMLFHPSLFLFVALSFMGRVQAQTACPGLTCSEGPCKSILFILTRVIDDDAVACGYTEPGEFMQWNNPLTNGTPSNIEDDHDLCNILFGADMCVNAASNGNPCKVDADCGVGAPPGSCAPYDSFAHYFDEASYGRLEFIGSVAGYYDFVDRSDEPGFDPLNPPSDHYDSYPSLVCTPTSINSGKACATDNDCPPKCKFPNIVPCPEFLFSYCVPECETVSQNNADSLFEFRPVAEAYAESMGFDPDDYDDVVLLRPLPCGSCGSTKSGRWIDVVARELSIHETGHLLTNADHSNILDCPTEIWGPEPPCEEINWGHPYDIMGAHLTHDHGAGHITASRKHDHGWLDDDPSADPSAQTVITLDDDADAGTYFLTPLEVAGENDDNDCATALRMARGDDYYYFEFRRRLGWDDQVFASLSDWYEDDFPADAWDGLIVSASDSGRWMMLDMTPGSVAGSTAQVDFLDGQLPLGGELSDPASCFEIRPIAILEVGHAQNPHSYPIIEVQVVLDLPVEDPDGCVSYTCSGGQPTAVPHASGTSCDDGLFCTETDACDGAGTCAGSGNPCQRNETCSESFGGICIPIQPPAGT